MSELPNWIDDRLDRNLDNTLTQEHVVETMVAADRPFFSARQLQARVKPDVSKATVRNRLDELQEIDVVATETYPDSVTLYYIAHDESAWPLSPEGRHALKSASPLDRLSIGFHRLSDTVGSRPLVLAGLICSGVLFVASGLASLVGIGLVFEVRTLQVLFRYMLAIGGLTLLATAGQAGVFFLVLFIFGRRRQ